MKLRQQIKRMLKWGRPLSPSSATKQSGFTLTELLVVIAISGVIVSALMGLVVELIGTEQRESSRTETQRSMQLALNYIAADLRQAVHIYNADAHPVVGASQPSYMRFLPQEFEDQDYRPVIAFWKPRPIDVEAVSNSGGLPDFDQCRTVFNGTNDTQERLSRECENLWKQRRAYSLVVYLQVPRETANPNGKWEGESRIVRYELFKFDNLSAANAVAVFDRTPGFVDPAELGANSFSSWPYSDNDNCQSPAVECVEDLSGTGRPNFGDSPPQVLVDFVDDPDSVRANADGTPSEPAGCEDVGPNVDDYQRIPEAGIAKTSSSFFVCLKDNNGAVGSAQDVLVYLRGNARGRGGNNSDAFLPTLQTRVTMRGVIDKDLSTTPTAPAP